MNDFRLCLNFSHAAADWPGWKTIYRGAFRQFASMVDHRQDGAHQRAGIDRTVVLANGKTIRIDEKARGRNKKTGKVYRDIVLEHLSDETQGTPGWVCKPLLADYIAYAILPLGICHLLPVEQLQLAWQRHSKEWRRRFHDIRSENRGWWTVSTPVPAPTIYQAIGACLRVSFDPIELSR